MFEGLYALGRSLGTFFTFWPLTYALGATLVGILVGCMPGLSATLAIALISCWLLPETVFKALVRRLLMMLYRVDVIGRENMPQPGAGL